MGTTHHLTPLPHPTAACCDASRCARPQQRRHSATPLSHPPPPPHRAKELFQAKPLPPARSRPDRSAAARERHPSSRSRRRTNRCRARARRRTRSTRTGPSGERLGRAAPGRWVCRATQADRSLLAGDGASERGVPPLWPAQRRPAGHGTARWSRDCKSPKLLRVLLNPQVLFTTAV